MTMRVLPLLFLGLVALLGACRDEELTNLAGGITGQVCNPVTGRPAAGATITGNWVNPFNDKEGTKDTTADENGFFTLGGMPVTTVTLAIRNDEFQNELQVEIVEREDVQLTDPACRDLPGEPGMGELVGQICNRHTGEYITEGTVTVLLASGEELVADIQGDGSFVMPEVPIGIHVVYVQAPGFQKTYQVEVTEGGQTLLEDQVVDCQEFDQLSTGMIVGSICGPSDSGEGGPLAGAHVYVVQPIDGIVYESWSLDDGTFAIEGIPAPQTGLQVRAEKGGFVYTWDNVNVYTLADAPDGTNVTASVDCQELVPDDDRRYLVVQGTFDKIEQVLSRMGLTNVDLLEGVPMDPSDLWSTAAFGNYETLSNYDAVFVNCGISETDLVLGLNGAVKENLKRYIREGGSLYVSDWAYDLVEQVWPERINFLGEDTVNSDAEHGEDGDYGVDVLEPGLADYVGSSDVTIGFSFGNFAIVSQLDPTVTTYLRGDVGYRVNGGVSTLTDVPVTVGFSDGYGRVIFTSFHQETNDAGETETLDGPEDLVLRYLIFSL
ncbi:MAG: carboxypeptidase regulatory-like domain-containing protein [Deltaproteobacteria bacterium]|nr:carboxypeptidase regulatory-like domain-containing protein [Deltaproteobacteria bacterium]